MKDKMIFLIIILFLSSLSLTAQRKIKNERTRNNRIVVTKNRNSVSEITKERNPINNNSYKRSSGSVKTRNNRNTINSTKRRRKHDVVIYKRRNPKPKVRSVARENTYFSHKSKERKIIQPIEIHEIGTCVLDLPILDYVDEEELRIDNVDINFEYTDDTKEFLEDVYKVTVKVEPLYYDFFEPFGLIIEYYDSSEEFIVLNKERDLLEASKQYEFESEIVVEPYLNGYVDVYLTYYDSYEKKFYKSKAKPFLTYITEK